MLEIKHPGVARNGLGYLNAAAAGLRQGRFVKIDGTFSADSGPSGSEGNPGYASSGDLKYSPATSSDVASTLVFPFKKYIYKRDVAETTTDIVYSGYSIVVYEGGEFETDQYSDISDDVTPGTWLYLDANSRLTTGYSNDVPARAIFVRKSTTFDSDYTQTGAVWFKLITTPPVTLHTISGGY